ncbi:MAG: tRNA (adenosine(37)-N6)-threonylcarbamoyltransferase complex ATPase subunit type 1 TsaE, partial [Synergistaceae bacterium]|nr:tRNA (adenosine(37)-N6)-threonylcarbamoyltransferase complex ATPase subunit type 1 TsaE [Synergistaceae bacterium]
MSCIGDSKPVFHVKFPAVPSRSPSETARFGEALARHAYSGLLVLLMGDLGSGKTLLAKSVGSFLGAADMRSPTFMIELVHKLPGKNFSIAHFDLYRLGPDGGDDVGLQLYEGSD